MIEYDALYSFLAGALAFIFILALTDHLRDVRKKKSKPSLPKRLILENARRDSKQPERIAINRILE